MGKSLGYDGENKEEKVLVIFSKRWILAYIGMLGMCVLYALRVNMSVAIVCMVRSRNVTDSSSNDTSCGTLDAGDDDDTGEFDWDKSTESIILSAFFYGYIVTQIPGGWIAGKFGGKFVIGFGIFITALATVLVPVSARWDYKMVVALRVIMGVAEGTIFPGMHAMWGKWAPSQERTRLTSFTYAGTSIGCITTFIVSGVLCAEGFDNGWGSIFYVTGGASLLWTAAWFYLVSNSPDEHPTISKAEQDYINPDNSFKKFKVPWRSLLTSRALWVCAVGHVCNNWMHYTLLTGLPSFMKEVLKFDIEQNGLLSAVPYMAQGVVILTAGHLADYLRTRWLTTTTTRRFFQALSFLASGALIIGTGFVSCDHRVEAVVLLTIAVGMEGLSYAGFVVNHLDFAPKYAGILYGITNFVSTIPGILAPIAVGALTPNKTQEEWRNVFYLCGAFTLIGAIVFGVFAQGEIEPWAMDEPVASLDEDGDPDKGKLNPSFKPDLMGETGND